jgi:very-short-patch-repair endonuclease
VLAVGRCTVKGETAGGESPASLGVLDLWHAAVSHRGAACLWELLPTTPGPVDVLVAGSGGRAKRSGIRVHRSRSLAPADVTLRQGIPVTTPARTIADLRRAISLGRSGAVSPRELRRAARRANVLGLPIGEESGSDRTRSDLERDFLRLCRRCRLPPPEVNVRIGRHLVDFLWRDQGLVVETDSYLYHRGRLAFQEDRGRDLELKRLGYEVLRVSERQVNDEPGEVAEILAAVLGRARQGGPRTLGRDAAG